MTDTTPLGVPMGVPLGVSLAALVALLISPFAGSFIGVLVRRIPAGEPWAWSRSHCPHCQHLLSGFELVPLVSFACLRGRCRWCGTWIDWFYPAIELAGIGTTALVIAAAGGDGTRLWPGCLLGWICLALFMIDLRAFRLPDILSLPLLLLGLASTELSMPHMLFDHACASLAGWAAFRGIALIYRSLRGIEALGAGDAKLLAAAGAWLGLQALAPMVCIACLLTLTAVLAQAAWQRRGVALRSRIAFGPGLAASLFGYWLLLA